MSTWWPIGACGATLSRGGTTCAAVPGQPVQQQPWGLQFMFMDQDKNWFNVVQRP